VDSCEGERFTLYEVELSLKNLSGGADGAFEAAAREFLTELEAINDLEITAEADTVPDSRGILAVLTGIIIVGAKIGAFAAIYALAKDLYARYVNCEVELKFADGSTLKVSRLSRAKAEKVLAEHLERGSAA
jgi:hypothetical protein